MARGTTSPNFGLGNKNKIFKDATQGYIQIPAEKVNKIIDTFEMQRLKDVAQTGIRPIFSSATHDRFSHSVGVYNLGVTIYDSFSQNVLADLAKFPVEQKWAEELLKNFEKEYHISCLLHDIGHPSLSHSFEYLYDNPFLPLEESLGKVIRIDDEEVQRLFNIFCDLKQIPAGKTRLQIKLCERLLSESGGTVLVDTIKGSPHEMMGAYQLLIDTDIRGVVREMLYQDKLEKAKCTEHDKIKFEDIKLDFIACMIIGAQYRLPKLTDKDKREQTDQYKERFERSLKNCIVRLLNGIIDADSLDYLNRNSHFAGYSTENLDIVRLSNAFSAHYDDNQVIFEPCLEKSAMSALEGFINARNFEPRWLYSHHKVVYYDAFLTKYLYKKCSRYLYAQEEEKWERLVEDLFKKEETAFLEEYPFKNPEDDSKAAWITSLNRGVQLIYKHDQNLKFETKKTADGKKEEVSASNQKMAKSADYKFLQIVKFTSSLRKYFISAVDQLLERFNADPIGTRQKMLAVKETILKWADFCAGIRDAYRGYLVSPLCEVYSESMNMSWYKTSDSDVNTLFKQMYLHYAKKEWDDLSASERAVNDRYDMFLETLNEHRTRHYRSSLWKTEQEYSQFLSAVQKRTKLSRDTINHIFINFIIKNGNAEEFDDVLSFNSDRGNEPEYNVAYLNRAAKDQQGEGAAKFANMFGYLGMGMVICIYTFRYKDFSNLDIRFATRDSAELVSLSDLSGDGRRSKEYMPFIYYRKEEHTTGNGEETSVYDLRQMLVDNLVKYILDTYGGINRVQANSTYEDAGKIIRDPVHGDIFVPQRFLKVIDTKAFQRLRRIKQLATADYVFPEACHTRFSHSIGTFHIMTLMMERICELFEYLHIKYTPIEKDAVLMAALLHDVGHGPYSHAFEKLSAQKKTHEDWTREIIMNDRELQGVFKQYFGEDFASYVVDCLHDEPGRDGGVQTLRHVFSALISSQLDADRLDYMMRDSYNTGVKFGIVDLQKVVSSLELTQYNGKRTVCISEDALSTVEQLILGRFNMYDTVYFAPYKAFSEQLLINIVKKIRLDEDLPTDGKLYKILNDKLTLAEYIELDDSAFQGEIYQYRNNCHDPITREMIDSFLNRRGYERLRLMDESVSANDAFLKELEQQFGIQIEDFCAFVYRVENYCAYKVKLGESNGAILIVGRNGVVTDLCQKSKIIRPPERGERQSEPFLETVRSCIYVNYDILAQEITKKGRVFSVNDVKTLVNAYSIRQHTEIEEKYSCTEEAIRRGQNLKGLLAQSLSEYTVTDTLQTKHQEDTYFDTEDLLLARNGYSFRCRALEEHEFVFTVKGSVDPNNGENGGQFIRSEFEEKAMENALTDKVAKFAEEHLSSLYEKNNRIFDISALQPRILVKNDRKSYNVKREKSNFRCEVSLDSVEFVHDDQSRKDWQVEIELKSQNAIHRVELKDFADRLREVLEIDNNMRETLSKYRKALQEFNML